MKRVIISGFWALSLATDQIPGPFLSPTVLLRVIKKGVETYMTSAEY